MLTLQRPSSSGISILKSGNDLVVAGYASVELVDKQGDLITRGALNDAFGNYMKSEKYRNVQLAHSNIQVGEVIDSYVDSNGRMWKSEVDDTGMFVVVQLRNDIEKAREVAAEIRKGNLQGFSIGGQAFKRVRKADESHGEYQEISKMELHEITICEKGINPEAQFRILKEDNDMSEEDNLMDMMNKLDQRLDAMEKGEMPEGLKEHMENKKEPKDMKEEKPKKKDDEDDDEGGMPEEMTEMAKAGYSDFITSEYLSYLEDSLAKSGVDVNAARDHFGDVEKAQLGGFDNPDAVDGADYFAGQVRGRGQDKGSPSTGAIPKLSQSGGKTPAGAHGAVELSKQYLSPSNVSDLDIQAAYEVYKAAAEEQNFRNSLESNFANRFSNEQQIAKAAADKAAFDAREPLTQVLKGLENLEERISNLTTEGTMIAKSELSSNVEIPTTQDLAHMSWDEVHSLADKVHRGA
tara:strand:- start:2207 stop:3598 length:1392 start_codon:yes stop_codon:yes gene_type:complete